MASVFFHKGVWEIKWRDGANRWQRQRTSCATKSEAKLLAAELEANAQRERLGLAPAPALTAETFGSLADWWWENYGCRLRDRMCRLFLDRHVLPTLGAVPLRTVSAAMLEGLLHSKEEELAPRSLNYIRALIHRVFAEASRRGRWSGANPAAQVRRRKEPKRLPTYLRAEEVAVMLENLLPHWRPLFATAVYTGMRKGELLGLLKKDVNLVEGTITVARSYGVDTTKGSHADLLPIADALRPYLEHAIRSSPSVLAFPRADGKMHERSVSLENVLRRSLAKAGLVDGYVLKCRRKGCGHQEQSATAAQRDCPRCAFRMWPSPIHRKVRFHDLRHTAATLLLKGGVPLATVQRVMRHTDPRITASVYGHLDVEDMRAAVNRLPSTPFLPAGTPGSPPLGGPVVDAATWAQKSPANAPEEPRESAGLGWSGWPDLNRRLPAPKSGREGGDAVTPDAMAPQAVDNTQRLASDHSARFASVPPVHTPFGGPVVDKSELLTVREVAARLKVSTATVYTMTARGELPHFRVRNSIRVRAADLP